MIAARSLPAIATERDRGSAAFIRSPSVGTFRNWVETGVMFGAAAGDARVLRAIDLLVGAGEALVEPFVGDDPGPRRPVAGKDGGMARAGLGHVVALVAGREHHPLLQPPQPAGEMLAILGEQVGRELIDGDGDDQLRRRPVGGGRGGGESERGGGEFELHGAVCNRRGTPDKASIASPSSDGEGDHRSWWRGDRSRSQPVRARSADSSAAYPSTTSGGPPPHDLTAVGRQAGAPPSA